MVNVSVSGIGRDRAVRTLSNRHSIQVLTLSSKSKLQIQPPNPSLKAKSQGKI
jgi:hypothetical protein